MQTAKKLSKKKQQESTASVSRKDIVIYKQMPKVVLDPTIVADYLAEKENKVNPVPNEAIIVPDSPNAHDDSVIFVEEVPASREVLTIARLNKENVELRTQNRMLKKKYRTSKPKEVIVIEDDDELSTIDVSNDGYDGDDDATVESQNGINLGLDESWVQQELNDLGAGDIMQELKELEQYL